MNFTAARCPRFTDAVLIETFPEPSEVHAIEYLV
jgi:hypothetical protein